MLTMLWIRFKEYKRAWLSFVVMTLMSIGFIYAFGLGFSNESLLHVGVVNESKQPITQSILTRLQRNKDFVWIAMEREDAIKALEEDSIIAAVILPEDGFMEGKSWNIPIMQVTDRVESVTIQTIIRDIATKEFGIDQFLSQIEPLYVELEMKYNKTAMREDIVELMDRRPAMTMDTSVYESSGQAGYNQLKQSFMGFMLFLSLFTMIFGVGSIVEDKEMKIWHRQRISPLSMWQIMGSVLITGFVMGMLQLLLIVVSGHLIFEIDLGPSIFGLLVLLSGYTFASISMGLFISRSVKTHQQLSAISPLIIVATSMLGGCMWPLEFVTNPIIRFLSRLTPQRYGMEGLEVLIVRQQGFESMVPSLVQVLLLGSVFLFLALIPLRKSREIVRG